MMMNKCLSVFLFVAVLCASFLPQGNCISQQETGILAFRNAISSDPHSALSTWNGPVEHCCNWSGIVCRQSDLKIVAINLSGLSLKGFLAPEIGLLTSLKILNLRSNKIEGTIPKQIGNLIRLKMLDLSNNQLSGAVPIGLGHLLQVSKIFLEGNNLAGNIPPELGNLGMLEELHLQRNKLQGTIPGSVLSVTMVPLQHGLQRPQHIKQRYFGLCCLKQLTFANFSNNFLAGKIPSCLRFLPSSCFEWNCLQDSSTLLHHRPPNQCGRMFAPINAKPEAAAYKESHPSKPLLLFPLEVASAAFIGAFILAAIFMTVFKASNRSSITYPWKKLFSCHEGTSLISGDTICIYDVPFLPRQELETACEDFSNIIGSSPDSGVYKGITENGSEIAVTSMCIAKEDWNNNLEGSFYRKVSELAKLNHRNIVKLLGYCVESEPFTRMLIFEYTSNGTLYEHLHYGDPAQLIWSTRMKIVLGIAQGLHYLHHELENPEVLTDVDSNAVYLTEDFCPKLANLEVRKSLMSSETKRKHSTDVACTSSEYAKRQKVDTDKIIFSFGVLLLEIITGRLPSSKEHGSLLHWAQKFLECPEVISYLVAPSVNYFRYNDLEAICEVVRLCTNSDSSKRPSMAQILRKLEAEINPSFDTAELKGSPLTWAEHALLS